MKDIPNIEIVSKILETIDTDQNGAINYNEFIAATMDTEKMLNTDQDKFQDAFSVFDKNGDGKITVEELKEALASETADLMDQKVWEDIIKEADINNDGVIDYEEFMKVIG